MVRIQFHTLFKKRFSKIKDKMLRQKVLKQIDKLRENPKMGKPMMYCRKGTRELYISPFRLAYILEKNQIKIINLYHKDFQ